jgi:hypothetical protein
MAYVGTDLDLYPAIVKRCGALARAVVVSIGLVAFVVLQVLANILGGAFAPLIVRSTAVWSTVSIVSWIVAGASFSFSLLQYTRDLHEDKELLDKDCRRREREESEYQQRQEKGMVSMGRGSEPGFGVGRIQGNSHLARGTSDFVCEEITGRNSDICAA